MLYNTTWNTPTDWTQGNKVCGMDGFQPRKTKWALCLTKKETVNYGIDLTTGKLAWGPSSPPQYYLDSFEDTKSGARLIYEGKLYSASCSRNSILLRCQIRRIALELFQWSTPWLRNPMG